MLNGMRALDVRYTLRRLRQAPGYAASAILTLALAIGATTAIFSAVHAVLLKGMPIRQPDRLAVAWGVTPARNAGVFELSYLDVQDLANATPETGDVASMGASAWPTVLDGEGEPRKLSTTGVSGRFFEGIRRDPVHGPAPSPGRRHTQGGEGRGHQSCLVGRPVRIGSADRRPTDSARRGVVRRSSA